MRFDTPKFSLAEIEALAFAGNYDSDAHLFRGIDAFADDKSRPLADRIRALRIASERGMGMPSSDEDTAAYLASKD